MGCPVVHFEIGCRDLSKTAAFYTGLFGWKTLEAGPALMIETGSEAGVQGHFTALCHEPFKYTTFYISVDDPKAYLERITQAGGKTVIGPIEVPGKGTFAWFNDPDGNLVGLWKPAA